MISWQPVSGVMGAQDIDRARQAVVQSSDVRQDLPASRGVVKQVRIPAPLLRKLPPRVSQAPRCAATAAFPTGGKVLSGVFLQPLTPSADTTRRAANIPDLPNIAAPCHFVMFTASIPPWTGARQRRLSSRPAPP